ncbi:MAG: radical SAM protein [Spirochaetes bacterium]|nr:radical SAM protein [Spirochaetota bacterium]
MKKKRILFVQLPLTSHSHDYNQGNIEYASASIAGYIIRHVTAHVDIQMVPSVITQFCANRIIVKYILNVKPDILAFTCFLWNVERSLSIARAVKEMDGSIQIIFGGSEINPGSIAMTVPREYVDYFVTGEGEWFFHKLLCDDDLNRHTSLINGNRVATQPADELVPVEKIVEPFSNRRLNPMADGSAFFELTRGCPYRCSYCLYSKNVNLIRELPFDALIGALTNDYTKKILSELYILSPALNTTRQFETKLELLETIGHGIRLHSEMRAGGVDKKMAQLLYKAGFRSMEVGLQTMNLSSLNEVGRNSSPACELEGMKHLKNAGIDIKIGLMPGLPGDTRDSFLAMADMLIKIGFKENIELYPLMILPGTLIRDNADRSGINYLKKPPYYYNYGWGMSFDDLRDITKSLEDATGFSHIVRKLPDFTGSEKGLYCRGISCTSDDLLKYVNRIMECIETNVFDFFIQVNDETGLYQGVSELMELSPDNQLYNIIVYENSLLDETKVVDAVQNCANDTFMERINIFHEWKDGSTLRVYQIIDEYEKYCAAKSIYSFITPIFKIHDDNYNALSLIHDYEDNVLVARGLFKRVKNQLKKFADSIESIAFEDYSEEEAFYKMIGYDYIKMPYTFKVLHFHDDAKL